MKIGYYSNLNPGSGVGNYECELYDRLSNYENLSIDPITIPSCSLPIIGKYVSFILKMRRSIKDIAHKYDIIHLPAQFQAACLIDNNIDAKTVVTAHDIIPYVAPEFANILTQKFSSVVINGIEQADHIISISNHTKSDIIDNTDISEQNVSVIYPSISKEWLNDPAPRDKLKEYNITDPYILYVGSQGRKKNIKTLINSCADINDNIDLQIVIVGEPGNPLQLLRSEYLIKKSGLKDQIIRTGFVDQPVLARLYHSACAFVFPTKYEGYGRPPLESMCAGTPVIASNRTAVPEIVDNAAVLVNPNNPEDWTEAIEGLLRHEQKRAELRKKGWRQANKYSWEMCASKTLRLYRDVLSNRENSTPHT
jgi:glycosyltransferase involved in cell wall biosynthesis